MRRHEIEEPAADAHLCTNEAAPLDFARIQIKVMVRREDWRLCQNRDAVLPALITKIEREGVLHLRQLGELRNFVDALSALDAAINFLQADQIRMLLIDDSSDPSEVELLVHADAYMNVVGHHANGATTGYRSCATDTQKHKEQQDRNHSNRSRKPILATHFILCVSVLGWQSC